MKSWQGLSDSVAGVAESPARCRQCGATARWGSGLCLSCTLREGLDGDRESSRESFEAILAEDEVHDTYWRVGNYEILEEIGRGGMGVIYRARQRHSRRIVALKRMVSYHADSRETLERFRREAEAAASLDHPNILPIYEVGHGEDGLPFFSMKYAAGGSLQKAGPALRSEPRQSVQLMAKVARAVQYAHEHGVLHRDLKPGNILLDSRGEPFVTDFGLAKWLDTSTDLTRTLTIFGTPGYIAPEQARGPAAKLTPAADVYSLGAVFFDLFTGRPPFLGEHALAVIQQAREKPAPKLRSLAPAFDRDLETICARCLEREPHARYRSAGDLAVDLERWLEGRPIIARRVSPPVRAWRWSKRNPKLAAATAAASCSAIAAAFLFFSHNRLPPQSSLSETVRSVAVLPLKNVTGNPENEYLTDGLTEALISSLSKTEGLKVISRGSAFAFKGKEIDPREVGRQLGVMTIVEGGLVKSEGAARVSVQLVSTTDGRVLWSGESFDHSFGNVVRLENELIRSVAAAIRPKLGNEQESRITKRYTESPGAYQLYLKGRYFWNERTEADIKKAIHYFNHALEKDPNYALAYAGLADSYALLNYYDGSPPSDSFPKARELAEKALKIDDTLAEAHASLAYVKRAYDWDWAGAEREFKRAIELNPNYATAHFWYGEQLTYLGRFDQGIAEIKHAEELNPLSQIISGSVGWAFHMARQPDRAIEQLRKTLGMDPGFPMTHFYLGMAYQGKQMYDAAIDEYRKSAELSPLGPGIVGLGHAYAMSGMRDDMQKVLNELMKRVEKNQARPTAVAIVYAGLNDRDHAFEWMEKAYEQRAEGVVYLKAQPYFDSLRSDPRRAAFLRRIGLE
jgi:eukaryotic-like serine/threonine-protein kinase